MHVTPCSYAHTSMHADGHLHHQIQHLEDTLQLALTGIASRESLRQVTPVLSLLDGPCRTCRACFLEGLEGSEAHKKEAEAEILMAHRGHAREMQQLR